MFIFFFGYYPILKGILERIKPKALSYLVKFLIFNLALVLAYVYPLLAQFDNSIKNTLKNACLLAIGSLPYSLVMAALNLLPVALFLFATSFFFRTAIFWVLIGGALVAYLNMSILKPVFKKLVPSEFEDTVPDTQE